MLPQIGSWQEAQAVIIEQYPSRTYKLQEKSIAGFVDELNAIEQFVRHCLNTERYAYAIYSDAYGMPLSKYRNKSFGYIEANIAKDIRESLLQDDRIEDVTNFVIEQTAGTTDSATIGFIVHSNIGSFITRYDFNA